MKSSRRRGAPNRQVQGAPRGRQARIIVPDLGGARIVEDEARRDAFRRGFWAGLALGLAILAAVMVLWAVPTVDGCVDAVTAAQGASRA